MKAAHGGAALTAQDDPDARIYSPPPPVNQLPPLEVHEPIADDCLVLMPSQRRPLRRDLERLSAHFAGWDRPPHSLVARWRP